MLETEKHVSREGVGSKKEREKRMTSEETLKKMRFEGGEAMKEKPIPVVGWYDRDGRTFLSTWYGETERLIVSTYPKKRLVPAGSLIEKVPESLTHEDAKQRAIDLNGYLVIAFTRDVEKL